MEGAAAVDDNRHFWREPVGESGFGDLLSEVRHERPDVGLFARVAAGKGSRYQRRAVILGQAEQRQGFGERPGRIGAEPAHLDRAASGDLDEAVAEAPRRAAIARTVAAVSGDSLRGNRTSKPSPVSIGARRLGQAPRLRATVMTASPNRSFGIWHRRRRLTRSRPGLAVFRPGTRIRHGNSRLPGRELVVDQGA